MTMMLIADRWFPRTTFSMGNCLLPAGDNEHAELLILLIVNFQGQHFASEFLLLSADDNEHA